MTLGSEQGAAARGASELTAGLGQGRCQATSQEVFGDSGLQA